MLKPVHPMNVLRLTVVDDLGTVSFIAPCPALPALVAACAGDPTDLESLLGKAERYFESLRDSVLNGLAVFDEHNSAGRYESIHAALDVCGPTQVPVFRVVDELTRQASLQPVKAGAVLFNLPQRRIVQLANGYSPIQRKGRVRVHAGSQPTVKVLSYELPAHWTLVP